MIEESISPNRESNFLYKTAQKEVVSSNSLLHHAEEEEEDLKSDPWLNEKQVQDNEAMKQIVTTQVNGGRSRNSPS